MFHSNNRRHVISIQTKDRHLDVSYGTWTIIQRTINVVHNKAGSSEMQMIFSWQMQADTWTHMHVLMPRHEGVVSINVHPFLPVHRREMIEKLNINVIINYQWTPDIKYSAIVYLCNTWGTTFRYSPALCLSPPFCGMIFNRFTSITIGPWSLRKTLRLVGRLELGSLNELAIVTMVTSS